MIKDKINRFLALIPLEMPELTRHHSETVLTETSAMLLFNFDERLTMGIVMNMCDEQGELEMLFQATSNANPLETHCCFFPLPFNGNEMYKINIESDKQGFVDSMKVYIYDDASIWEQELEKDLSNYNEEDFTFHNSYKVSDVLKLFLRG